MKNALEFLRLLSERQVPETPARHALVIEGDMLALKLSIDGGFYTVFFDPEDFAQEPSALVDAAIKEWERAHAQQNAEIGSLMQAAAVAATAKS